MHKTLGLYGNVTEGFASAKTPMKLSLKAKILFYLGMWRTFLDYRKVTNSSKNLTILLHIPSSHYPNLPFSLCFLFLSFCLPLSSYFCLLI